MSTTHDFEVRQVTAYVFDVFRGDGWENWSRFQRQGNSLKLIGGSAVTQEEFRKLLEIL
jgi:hypothetical protein